MNYIYHLHYIILAELIRVRITAQLHYIIVLELFPPFLISTSMFDLGGGGGNSIAPRVTSQSFSGINSCIPAIVWN